MGVADVGERFRRLPAPAVDAGLAVATALAVTVAIGVAVEPGARRPDAVAHLIGLAVAVPLLFRRRWPLAALVASIAVLMAYYSLGYPGFSPAVPLGVAVYTAAATGHLRGALVAVVTLYGGGTVFRLLEDERALSLLSDTVRELALVGALLFLGDAVRSRRAYAAEVRDRLARAGAEREREAQRRVAEERLRIAREIHDVIAHTVSVITVQAGVAADVLDSSPEAARSALATIRTASREASAELGATLGVLRDGRAHDPAPRAPAPRLAELDGLVDRATSAGLDVEVNVDGDPRPLPAATELTAYRIVQESLTNVVRHAGARSATVAIRFGPATVEVDVEDDGGGHRPEAGGDGGGHGLAGMRERAVALGGSLEARSRPAPGTGFRVHARLPTGPPAE